MPKKNKNLSFGRGYRGKSKKKRGAGWNTGQTAKLKLKRAATRGSAAPPAAAEAAPQAEPPAAPLRTLVSGKPSLAAVKCRNKRDAAPKQPQRRSLSVTAAKLPKDLGATASGRNSAFRTAKGTAEQAYQKAEYHERKASTHLKKLARKDPAKAAATLGGVLREPDIRPLHAAAGSGLSEDASLDTQCMDHLAKLLGPAKWSSCCTSASRWRRTRGRRRAPRRSRSRWWRWARQSSDSPLRGGL